MVIHRKGRICELEGVTEDFTHNAARTDPDSKIGEEK